jgi:hypothetical protein
MPVKSAFSADRLLELEGDAVPFAAAPRLIDPVIRLSTLERVLREAFRSTGPDPDADPRTAGVTEAFRAALRQSLEAQVASEVQRVTADLSEQLEQLKALVRESQDEQPALGAKRVIE